MIEVRPVKNKKELQQLFFIRKEVFVNEQKVDPSVEFDGLDDKAEHIAALLDNNIVGCARVRYMDNKAKLERIALLKEYRGNGFGGKILKFLISYCRDKGVTEIYLHSQIAVKGFYRRFGFIEKGEPFLEAGIPHIEMYMKLK